MEQGEMEYPGPEVELTETGLRLRFQDKFNSVFEEVLRDEKPHINVATFFSPHGIPGDLEGRREEIEESDMFFPEAFRWRQYHLDILRSSASGQMSDEEFQRRITRYLPIFQKTLEDVRNTNVAIGIVDVPARNRLERESRETWIYEPNYEGNFSDMLEGTKGFLRGLADYHNQREEYMLNQVSPEKIRELLEVYPELRDKQNINVLMSFGMGHSLMPYGFPESHFTDEAIMATKNNINVNDNLLSKVYLEKFFYESIYNNLSFLRRIDSRKSAMFQRRVIDQLGINDAQRIFSYVKERGINPRQEFDSIFYEMGMTLPGDEMELDEWLLHTEV